MTFNPPILAKDASKYASVFLISKKVGETVAKKTKRKGKGKYYTHVEPKLVLVEGWARDGLIDEQIAKNLGVAYSTFREYKKRHPALMAALTKGKEVVDFEVENKLLQRAMGYEYEEVTYEHGIEVKRVTKHVAPDTTAQIFWLKNRRPDKWRDRRDIEHSGAIDTNPLKDLSTEDLRSIAKQAKGDK